MALWFLCAERINAISATASTATMTKISMAPPVHDRLADEQTLAAHEVRPPAQAPVEESRRGSEAGQRVFPARPFSAVSRGISSCRPRRASRVSARCSTLAGTMRLALAVAVAVMLSACGGEDLTCGAGTTQVGDRCVALAMTEDPLVGRWSQENCSSPCEFFANGAWNSCCGFSGWASTWERLANDEYYLGISNGDSYGAQTTFSSDKNAVTMVVRGSYSYSTRTLNLTRVP